MNIENKVIWITGASSGIGEALVKSLAKKNAKLILSARRKEALEAIVKVNQLHPDNFLILDFDLADCSKADYYTQQILQKFGRIDILINNGGMSQRSEAIHTPIDIERKIMEVNYFSATSLTKAVLPAMVAQGSGKIVVISSISGKFGFFLRSSYSAAKHALHGYFESLRLENEKKGISVLLVCPGKIKTNVSLNAITESGQTHNKMDESHQDAMPAEACAEKIIEAIKKDKEEILIGGKEIKAVWLKRFLPGIFAKIIRKQSPF